jgi:CRP/FNR family cyclic AMP-dependent transcriptional regulator
MPGTDDTADLLARTALFGGLEQDALASLAAESRVREYPRGQFAFFEGDESNFLLVVAKGRVKVYVSSPEGNELLLNIMEEGSTIGEVGIVDGGPRSASAVALEPSTLVMVPAEAVREVAAASPELKEQLLLNMTEMVRRLTGTSSDLVFLDLPRRLAKLIVTACDSAEGGVADLGLTQGELGNRLGATRQSVNTALRTFARRGLIAMEGQRLKALDVEALERFAEGRF